MKIGILYIALGRYYIFWKDFYESSEKYFLPECEKHYFLFTDSNRLKNKYQDKNNITLVHHEKIGWPYDTLMRFEIFLKKEKDLEMMDYIYFFNANMEFVSRIERDEFLPKDEGLAALNHPYYYNTSRKLFPYDTNLKSLAYIAEDQGKYYFMGSLNGGKTKDYLELIRSVDRNIKIDLQNDVIALWHDESHLNKYLLDKEVFVIPYTYGYPEEKLMGMRHKVYNTLDYRKRKKGGGKIVMTDKENYRFGGRYWLRQMPYKNVLKEKVSFWIAQHKIRLRELRHIIIYLLKTKLKLK